MALSEREEALLQQMEEALYAEDPRFATRIQRHKGGSLSRGRLVLAVLAALGGLGLIVAGATMSSIPLGAIGFAVMVAGLAVGFTPSSAKPDLHVVDGTKSASEASSKGPKTIRRQRGATSGSFMQRMEQRWDKRKHDEW